MLAARGSRTSGVRSGASCRRSSRGCCDSADDAATARRRARRVVAVGIELRRCHALGRRERNVNEIGPNFIARPYRGVSVQDVDDARGRGAARARARAARVPADRVHRRRRAAIERALVQVEREDGDGILVGVRDARILARPRRGRVRRRRVGRHRQRDAARARRARERARVTVVQGRFQHVNFIFAPAPLRIRVLEVVPPHPPKLLEMAQAVLDFDEDLPPVAARLRGDRHARAGAPRTRPGTTCSRAAAPDWTSTPRSTSSTPVRRTPPTGRSSGCERSRQIHEALYGARPARTRRLLPAADAGEPGAPTLLKCCLRERGIEQAGNRLDVPWGASLDEVREALHARLVAA